MTDRIDLGEIAARCEATAIGSFDLDKAILRALGYTWRGLGYWFHDDSHQWRGPARFTSSIDAALALIPEGEREWELHTAFRDERFGRYQARVNIDLLPDDPDETGPQGIANGATPALAICAAALRAREAR